MGKIINFNKVKETTEPAVIATTYYMNYTVEDGTVHKRELTGEEIISTACPECGKEHTFTFDDFLDIMKDGDLYGTMVYCSECSKKNKGR